MKMKKIFFALPLIVLILAGKSFILQAKPRNTPNLKSIKELYPADHKNYKLIESKTVVTPWKEAISDYAFENNITYEMAEKKLLSKSRANGSTVLTKTNKYKLANGYAVSVRVRYVRYSYGSFRQFSEVISISSYPSDSNHTWHEVEGYDYNREYPTTNLNIEVFGYSEIQWDESASGGFDVPGFSANYSVGTTTYYGREQTLNFYLGI
ncbi:MAG: hypothetical protein ACK5LT_06005 [Lachnospirales bacterium]